jgi:CO/xanthine dehydrogenase Mo-binding subunit
MRRGTFLTVTTSMGAGLALGAMLPTMRPVIAAAGPVAEPADFSPNVWVHVRTDGTVKVMLSKSEMGQGIYTGLPMLVAEELDVPMSSIVCEFAPADDAKYGDKAFTGDLTTGGSTSTPDMWPVLRQAGATARAMLVAAAAQKWGVPVASCSTKDGVVISGMHHATYAELAPLAATLPIPTTVALKDPAKFTVIGTSPKRLDIDAKVRGTAQFGIDVVLPGMLYANVAKSPTFGGTVVSFDATAAKAVPGVVDVFPISSGVAVVATNTWAAFQGAEKVNVTWKPGMTKGSPELFAEAEHLARTTTVVGGKVGAGDIALAHGKELGAVYKGPFLAHTPMEPMNTTVWVKTDGNVEIWSPTQVQSRTKAIGMQITGAPADKVQVHTTFLGGGFGRRLHPDFVVDAVEIGKHMTGKPVKMMWRREDDVKNDAFRPMAVSVVRAKLDDGNVVGWEHRTAQKSIVRTWAPPLYKNGLDPLAIDSCTPEDYAFPNAITYYADHDYAVPVGFMRAPSANWNCFVTESFMDELAHAAGADPLAFRLANMTEKATRARAVLQLAAEKASWGHPLPGATQGLAMGWWGGAYSAIVADVVVDGSTVHVKRAVIAVDVGRVVHPDIALAQIQGALNYGLAMALTAKITLTKGVIDQNNFYDYTVLRMTDSPVIEAYIVPSTADPRGIGELGVPAIAPAVGNAIFRATGKRVRSLPFKDALA